MNLWQKKWFLPSCFLAIMACNLYFSARTTSVTVDEFAHLPAGVYYWKTKNFGVYHHNPPLIRMIAALPAFLVADTSSFLHGTPNRWMLGDRFLRSNRKKYQSIFMLSRLTIMMLTLLTGFLLFWAVERWTTRGSALVALILFCFSPTFLAHGALVTTDAGFCLAFLATSILCAQYFRRPSRRLSIGLGIVLGVAQLTKFTALILYPLIVIGALMLPLITKTKPQRTPVTNVYGELPRFQRLTRLLIPFFISLIVINAGYLFKGSGQPIAHHTFKTSAITQLANGWVGRVPSPLPKEFVKGFDAQLFESSGKFKVYLMGQKSKKGWWYYYPAAMFFKMPLPFWILFAFLFCLLAIRKLKPTILLTSSLLLSVVLLFSFSTITKINLGIRYVLFVLPFLFMAVAQLAHHDLLKHRTIKVLLGACLGWYCLSSLANFPHYLGYFSEAVGGAKQGYKYLADSNLDWGQDWIHLKKYMDKHNIQNIQLSPFGMVNPAVYGIPYQPLTAKPTDDPVVISVNNLLGLTPFPGNLPPLDAYRRRKPDAIIGRSLWLFD